MEGMDYGQPSKLDFLILNLFKGRVHLKQHIYQTADAIGLTGFNRHIWTSHILSLIDRGKVKKAIKVINRHFQNTPAKKRLDQLSNYIKRFSDACYYELYKIQGLPIGSGEVESASTLYPSKAIKDSRGDRVILIQSTRC